MFDSTKPRLTLTPRRATSKDIPEIVRVVNRAYRVEEFFITGDRTDERDIRERMSRPSAFFLVVDDGEQLAGSVYVELRGRTGYFGLLAVDPDHQQKGIARSLIEAVQDQCRSAGCSDLELDIVDLRAELPAFYTRMGFIPVATAPFPDPDKLKREAHMILMSKRLDGS